MQTDSLATGHWPLATILSPLATRHYPLPKIERGPIMATKPYLILHRRDDSDGQIARFLENDSPPTVPCHRLLVVMPRRAMGDRRRGRSVCQLVGSE